MHPTWQRNLGRTLSAIALLFLAFDGGGKVAGLAPFVEGTTRLGFAASAVPVIGVLEVAGVLLYAIPATAPLGAVVLTGHLGGAVATHVRLGSPLFTHTLFPVYVAAFVWIGLFLRSPRVRALVSMSEVP